MPLQNDTVEKITKNNSFTVPERNIKTLFDLEFSVATIYISLVVILVVIRVSGNIFIIYVMKKETSMKTDARLFILNMALADLCVSGLVDPMCIVGAILGLDSLRGGFWICVVLASMCMTVCVCAALNAVCLTVNRWIFICHKSVYNSIFTRKLTVALCISTWVIGFGADLPNYFGVGGHIFDEKTFQCIWDRTISRTYTMLMSLVIVIPLLILAFCNLAMLRKIWSVKKNLSRFSTNVGSTLKTSMESSKILLSMFLVFVVCWTPAAIVFLFDTNDTYSFEVYLMTVLLTHSHACSSCIIYTIFKRNFRNHLRGLFQRNRVHPSTNGIKSGSNNIVMHEIA